MVLLKQQEENTEEKKKKLKPCGLDDGCFAAVAMLVIIIVYEMIDTGFVGAQWLSDRVLDSRPRGRVFEPHRCHCVVVLEQHLS